MPATKRPIASPRSELNQSMPQLILRPLCFLWRLVGFRLGARGQRLWVMGYGLWVMGYGPDLRISAAVSQFSTF